MSDIKVTYAVYGALAGGNENNTQAVNVTEALQNCIDASQGIVTINNENMGGDPSVGNKKHFAALCYTDGQNNVPFACIEGQTIDFHHWLKPDTVAENVASA